MFKAAEAPKHYECDLIANKVFVDLIVKVRPTGMSCNPYKWSLLQDGDWTQTHALDRQSYEDRNRGWNNVARGH